MPQPETSRPKRQAAASHPDRTGAAPLPRELRTRFLRLMLEARLSDELEQNLKRRGLGDFQLSMQGHEALVGVALAMPPEDWLHPHYRDRALVLARGMTFEQFLLDYFAKQNSQTGGRQMPLHFNSRALRIISLSSPVGTNVLQAVGMARSFQERRVPEVVVALLGDAGSREGEVMEAMIEAAVDRLPVVFVFEDNGYGISTPTEGKTFWSLPRALGREPDGTAWCLGCRTEVLDGLDPEVLYHATAAALARARAGEGPACLVAKLERMWSHSCSDDQRLYREAHQITQALARDPVKRYTERCLAECLVTAAQLESWKMEIHAALDAALQRAQAAADPTPSENRDGLHPPLPAELPAGEQHRPAPQPKPQGGLTMAQAIARVLQQELRRNPRLVMLGEDLEDPKGDVFGIARGLSTAFPGRVRNSPLAEATIMGTSIGRAAVGDVAVAAVQFVDFIGPGLNQLLNEAATLYWRSNGEWTCPLVVLAPCGAYLPGLGPWHGQSGEALFVHTPGLHVAMPSGAADAAGLLRYALRCGRPVVYLYPKALLHSADDTVAEPHPECLIPYGLARTARAGRDVTLVTWGNGVPLCLKAAHRAAEAGVETEILDLRSLAPWDLPAVLASVQRTGRLLVMHEDNQTCGLGAEVVAEVTRSAFAQLLAPPQRLTRPDQHIPFHRHLWQAMLPDEKAVVEALRRLAATVRTTAAVAPAPAARPAPPVPSAPAAPVEPRAEVHEAVAASPLAARRIAVVVPKQSPTDEDATVLRFHVRAGQNVATGTLLVEMEANKGSFEIDSPHPGRVVEMLAKEGERVRVGSALLHLEVSEEVPAEALERRGEAAVPAAKEIRLSPAQLQVGILALKSRTEIPEVSIDLEADLTGLAVQRETLQAEMERAWGLHVSYTHLLLWAMVQALKDARNEGFRGRLDANGERLLIAPIVNVGFAVVGRHEDLFSPVIKRAETMTLRHLVRRAHELSTAVRKGAINVADLQGATVTLTNVGPLDATGGLPFVIPGQMAMLAAGSLRVLPRYRAVEGRPEPVLEPRRIMRLTLVFDHRPFNGTHAMIFLRSIRDHLQRLDLKAQVAGPADVSP